MALLCTPPFVTPHSIAPHIPDCITNRPSLNNSPYSISPAPSRTLFIPKTQTVAPRTSRRSSAKNVSANAPTASVDDSNGRNTT